MGLLIMESHVEGISSCSRHLIAPGQCTFYSRNILVSCVIFFFLLCWYNILREEGPILAHSSGHTFYQGGEGMVVGTVLAVAVGVDGYIIEAVKKLRTGAGT